MVNKTRQVLLHVTGCVLFLLLPVFFSPDFFRASYLFSIPPFQRDFLSYVLLLVFFYLSYFYIIPQLYFKKRYVLLLSVLVVCFLVMALLPDWCIPHSEMRPERYPNAMSGEMPPPPPRHHDGPPPNFMLFSLGNRFFKFSMAIAFSFLLRIHFRWKKAEQEKTDTELSYLKAQINPHFLFNTLNSIYSLAITKSNNTPDAIVKLSGLMRYVITDASHDFVPLEKEINYISDYIELQKIRLDDTVTVKYEIKGDVKGKQIAPLILIAFIENAFKHGVNPEEESAIDISVTVEGDSLLLTVRNNKVTHLLDGEVMNGMGIENANSRLQLLYPAKHTLEIQNQSTFFKIELTIDLA
jgi:hypothetical protein